MKKKILIVNANYYKEISLGLLKSTLKQFPKNNEDSYNVFNWIDQNIKENYDKNIYHNYYSQFNENNNNSLNIKYSKYLFDNKISLYSLSKFIFFYFKLTILYFLSLIINLI